MSFKSLHDVIIFCVVFSIPMRCVDAFRSSSWGSVKRSEADEGEEQRQEPKFIACKQQHLESEPGTFTFISDGGGGKFCSLYIAAPVDNVVEMEFTFFDVDCEDNGAVAILDGWELDFEIFPSPEDHPHPMSLRFLSFCGKSAPSAKYFSKQNIAQIQYIVPVVGQGFQVKVNFNINYKPCNMMLLSNTLEGITIRNYGLRSNCTAMSLYPQRVKILYVNVGEIDRDTLTYEPTLVSSSGLRSSCHSRMGDDSVELYQGTGVGFVNVRRVLAFCGIREAAAHRFIKLNCQSSSLRLVSSGEYYNVVKFSFLPANERDESVC